MELPTLSFEFATSRLPIGIVGALAITLIAAMGWMLLVHTRLKRRARALELELQVFKTRNEELSRLRLALETANQRLKRLVAVDALTGLANRRHFDRMLERELRRARREKHPLSLVFLDVDEFKRFNDSYGHGYGDEVLRKVAATLDETFRRGGDLIARYGGEEFAVVLPGVDSRRAGLYAERLRRRIWRLNISNVASLGSDRITISAGVATLVPQTPGFADTTASAFLRAADQALYRAKSLGRNRVSMAAAAPAPATEKTIIEMAS